MGLWEPCCCEPERFLWGVGCHPLQQDCWVGGQPRVHLWTCQADYQGGAQLAGIGAHRVVQGKAEEECGLERP